MHAKSMPAWRYYELFMRRLPELQFVGMHVLSKHLGIGEVCHSTLSSDLSNWLTWLGCVQVERAHKKTKSIVHTKKRHQLKAKNVQREVRASVSSLAFTPFSRYAHEDVCRDAPRSLSTTTRGRSTRSPRPTGSRPTRSQTAARRRRRRRRRSRSRSRSR